MKNSKKGHIERMMLCQSPEKALKMSGRKWLERIAIIVSVHTYTYTHTDTYTYTDTDTHTHTRSNYLFRLFPTISTN